MKFISHGHLHKAPRPWVYLDGSSDAAKNMIEQAGVPEIVPQNPTMVGSGNLDLFAARETNLNNSGPIIDGNIERASGSLPAETAAHIKAQTLQVVDQSSETAIQKSFSGERLARRFTLDRFGGLNFNLYDPRFWFGVNWLNPKQVILNQVSEAFADVGDPASLVEGSALISDNMFSALVNKSVVTTAIRVIENSGASSRNMNDVSLTSLELLRDTLVDRNERIQGINSEQITDFSAKANEEVWWKQLLRKPFFQKPLYNQKIKVIKNRNQAAHEELLAILDGVIQTKEQNIFTARQNVDQAFITAENAGPGTIPSLSMTGLELGHRSRETIHRILNQPDAFLRNPQSVQTKVPLDYLFGTNFVPLDILEALQTTRYEKFASLNVNYVDSGIDVNQWEMSHYNALRTIDGLQQRKARLDQFNKASFQTLEALVNQVYEPTADKINVDDPAELVAGIKTALESATPGLRQKVNNIIGNNVYANSTEQFWALAKYFNDHPMAFKALPPTVQQGFAGFFVQKRTDLERSLISGAFTEEASALWRSQALVRGQDVLSKVKDVAQQLPHLGTDLLSSQRGVAQNALQKLQSLIDSNQFFTDLVGEKGDAEGLLGKLPELERGLLDNVFLMQGYITQVGETLENLRTKRTEFEALLDVDPDFVESQRKVLVELQKKIETTGSGLGDINAPLAGLGVMGGTTGEDGEGGATAAGGGLEPRFRTLQREVNDLRQTLQGPPGNNDGGQIGAANKITGYTFPVPGRIEDSLMETANLGEKLLAERVKAIGVRDADNILKQRPTLDDLARLEMGELASRDMVATAKALLQNETAQQYERMLKNRETFISIQDIYVAGMNFQSDLTVEGVTQPDIYQNAQYVRTEADGGLLYQTATHALKILPPRIGEADSRNVLIFKKGPDEQGFGHFVLPYSNPDGLGTLLTSRPENSAFANNGLYGQTGKNIQAVLDRSSS